MNFKNRIKTFIYFYLNALCFFLPKRNRASILMYHSIGDNRAFFTVRSKEFEKQMAFLFKKRYNVISLAELVESKEQGIIPKKTIVLTFDDGYGDNYFNALPILKKYNFKATVFLTTGLIGKKRLSKAGDWLQYLNWTQIKEMAQTGLIDFQPHTINHIKLDKVGVQEAEKEIIESKTIIEKEINKKCDLFCYPYGNYNQTIIEILKNNNFRAGVLAEDGLVGSDDNLFELKRNSIDSLTNFTQFKGKLCFSSQIFNFLKKILKK